MNEKWEAAAKNHEKKAALLEKMGLRKEAEEHRKQAAQCRKNIRLSEK